MSSAVDPQRAVSKQPIVSPGWNEPLRIRAFRVLLACAAFSNIGVWMESVMAGFVMAQLTSVPSLVAAVPVAVALPGIVFALAAGALADASDRRFVLLSAKVTFFVGVLGLAVLGGVGGLSPFSLLVFSAVVGTAATFSSPAWWATIAELVPEPMLSRAFSLDGLQWNVGQMIGPALGGALLATIGAGGMFAVAAALMTVIVGFLFVWRGRPRSRLSTPGEGAAERIVGAVGAGFRYLANAPALQVTCWRTLLFVFPAGALTALLPLYASRQLRVGPIGYGALLAAVGVGSVAGALWLPRLTERFHIDVTLAAASLGSAACTVLLVFVRELAVVAVALAGTGTAWLVAVTALNIGAQERVPSWVLSRALGAYLMVFQGSIMVGALVWGVMADVLGLRVTLLVASATFLLGVASIRWLGMPIVDRSDLRVVPRPHPDIVIEPDTDEGPVMILLDYEIDEGREDEFVELMEELRVVRRRIGATRWSLFEDAGHPGRLLESFVLPSWGDYLLQRARYTAADHRVYNSAMALDVRPEGPNIRYFIHPESVVAYRRRARWRRLRGMDRALLDHGGFPDSRGEAKDHQS